jgi:hypothetical protein
MRFWLALMWRRTLARSAGEQCPASPSDAPAFGDETQVVDVLLGGDVGELCVHGVFLGSF